MPAQSKMFGVFHAMDAKGVFDSNPANSYSRDPVSGMGLFKGPVKFPKMLYHPKGDKEVISRGDMQLEGNEYKRTNLVERIITHQVSDQTELDKFLALGWHEHPAFAVVASGGEAPPMSIDFREKELEKSQAEIKAQQEEILAMREELERLKGSGAKAKGLGSLRTQE